MAECSEQKARNLGSRADEKACNNFHLTAFGASSLSLPPRIKIDERFAFSVVHSPLSAREFELQQISGDRREVEAAVGQNGVEFLRENGALPGPTSK